MFVVWLGLAVLGFACLVIAFLLFGIEAALIRTPARITGLEPLVIAGAVSAAVGVVGILWSQHQGRGKDRRS